MGQRGKGKRLTPCTPQPHADTSLRNSAGTSGILLGEQHGGHVPAATQRQKVRKLPALSSAGKPAPRDQKLGQTFNCPGVPAGHRQFAL